MSLNQQHRKNIVAFYCLLFYALMLFKWWSGLFLYQFRPEIFNTRFDLVSWFLMNTGLHQWLINQSLRWVLFDVAFYILPLFYWLAFLKNSKLARAVALVMLIVNWIYIQCYTLFPTNSIESYTCWLLFPILFLTSRLRSFFFVLQGLRYYFLFIFASAGTWKIIQLGIFNADQMSGVLLYQHKEFLTSSPGYWLTNFFYWLINHPFWGYLLYLAGTLTELFFIAGFFTKKPDRWLISAFIVFVVLDLFIMRIYYWELAPFLITLYYSRYRRPSANAR